MMGIESTFPLYEGGFCIFCPGGILLWGWGVGWGENYVCNPFTGMHCSLFSVPLPDYKNINPGQ